MCRYPITPAVFRMVFKTCRRYSSSIENKVILSHIKSCGIITLNRPKALNSLDLDMIRRIYPTLNEWNSDPQITHVIIEGTGGKAFCAGGDVRAVVSAAKKGDKTSEDFFREEYRLNHLIGTLSKPFIAILDGITMGGGVGLSVHGKFRLATENTLFAMPETAIGLFPDVGGGYFLPRLHPPSLGVFLALTGHRLRGQETLWANIATHFRESSELERLKENLVHLEVADRSDISSTIAHMLSPTPVFPAVPVSLAPYLDTILKVFVLFESGRPTTIEEILYKLDACVKDPINKGVAEWADKCKQLLLTMSPTSLKVTLRQLQEGSKVSFADDFNMEFRLSQRFVHGHDFAEGVRAVLIDKDNKPSWKPSTLGDVTQQSVDAYFTPLEGVQEWKPNF